MSVCWSVFPSLSICLSLVLCLSIFLHVSVSICPSFPPPTAPHPLRRFLPIFFRPSLSLNLCISLSTSVILFFLCVCICVGLSLSMFQFLCTFLGVSQFLYGPLFL